VIDRYSKVQGSAALGGAERSGSQNGAWIILSIGCKDQGVTRVQGFESKEGLGSRVSGGCTRIEVPEECRDKEARRVQGSEFQDDAGIRVPGGCKNQVVSKVHG
jgi:hypothetical protein